MQLVNYKFTFCCFGNILPEVRVFTFRTCKIIFSFKKLHPFFLNVEIASSESVFIIMSSIPFNFFNKLSYELINFHHRILKFLFLTLCEPFLIGTTATSFFIQFLVFIFFFNFFYSFKLDFFIILSNINF